MACVENIPPINVDSEMEEGEIIDDLSDISSEEEFLLRERLQVLENYNNVLERKKAKISSSGPGTKQKKDVALLYDLSEISANELDDYNCTHIPSKDAKEHRQIKSHHKKKRKKEDPSNRSKEKKKNYKQKKKLEVPVISETSDESEDEYRNRRRKLADAVHVNTDRNHHTVNEKSSLSVRLKKMLYAGIQEPVSIVTEENLETTNTNLINNLVLKKNDSTLSPISSADDYILYSCKQGVNKAEQVKRGPNELIDLCTDDDVKIIEISGHQVDTVDSDIKDVESVEKPKQKKPDEDSDEDLELLRQYALKTKVPKHKPEIVVKNVIVPENKTLSDDEDSDTAELRLICLKSAILKKAIEMKQKQKLKKRLSQSSNLRDELHDEPVIYTDKMNSENNTDIESVDMDIGSDVDEKSKEIIDDIAKIDIEQNTTKIVKTVERNINALSELNCPKEDELEEDEDLLRAKLLTSLSKNLSNLVNPNVLNSFDKMEHTVHNNIPKPDQVENIPEEKRFIIKLGESDSEGEHEATKNLTKMHMKLSEQVDFQQRLDMFLKSTRMEVEKLKPTDIHAQVQQTVPQKKNEKFIAKAVKHLPRSEQLEYKNLVKRMAELEKIKQVRQSTMFINQKILMKDTLKPRNVTFDSKQFANNLEEQITLSRKKIAEESAKMLRLKEEGKKMSQKYKIVATELRNIKTALAFNKKQQITVQNTLNKIRLQHQMLLKSSPTKHSKLNGHIVSLNLSKSSLQKENNPAKDEYKNNLLLKSVKVSIENDMKNEIKPISKLIHPRLSVQIDVNSNKKVVNLKNDNDNSVSVTDSSDNSHENKNGSHYPIVEKCRGNDKEMLACDRKKMNDTDDYKSPLDALGTTGWEGDPNAILCPFEVDGDCKDTDCKYLHTKSHIQ